MTCCLDVTMTLCRFNTLSNQLRTGMQISTLALSCFAYLLAPGQECQKVQRIKTTARQVTFSEVVRNGSHCVSSVTGFHKSKCIYLYSIYG